MTSAELQACNSIRGGFSPACQKIAYSTERFAAAALRMVQKRGRSEQSYYKCQQCSMFHLSGRKPKTNYRLEASNAIQVGTTRIRIGRKVKAAKTQIGMCMTFTAKDGSEKNSIFNMTPEQARTMRDALTEALNDSSEDAAANQDR